jgi:hypothetical protein
MQIVRSLFKFSVEKSAGGELGIKPTVFDSFMRDARMAFPDAFKPRTLILLVYNAPYFSDQLSQDEHAAYDFAFSQGISCLQKAGYRSVLIGPDLINEDVADRVHLAASGGQKMARDVAPEVRAMAVQLGYLPAAPMEQNSEENR